MAASTLMPFERRQHPSCLLVGRGDGARKLIRARTAALVFDGGARDAAFCGLLATPRVARISPSFCASANSANFAPRTSRCSACFLRARCSKNLILANHIVRALAKLRSQKPKHDDDFRSRRLQMTRAANFSSWSGGGPTFFAARTARRCFCARARARALRCVAASDERARAMRAAAWRGSKALSSRCCARWLHSASIAPS